MVISFGVWMILRGCGCMWNCVIPIGIQLASGLSLLSVDMRRFLISAAHGVMGRPPETLVPRSQNAAKGGDFGLAGNSGMRISPDTSPFGSRLVNNPASS